MGLQAMSEETIEMVTGPEAGEADADALTAAERAGEAGDARKPAPKAETDTEEDPDAGLKAKLTPEAQRAFDKRISRETRKTKEAQSRAEAAERELQTLRGRADCEDAEAVLAAAREAGVMPEILTAAESKGLADLNHAKANAKALGRVLRSTPGEELEIDGKTYTRKQVVDAQDSWEDKAVALEKRFGGVEAGARAKGLEIWRLGLAAKREGWKPGGAKPAPDADPDDPAEDGAGVADALPAAKPKPRTDMPAGGGPKARPTGEPARPDVEVHDERSLASFIDADMRARKKK
jgi:hypothetical protein